MNNTKNILLVAIITATLIMGTSVIPMQSYADRDNNDDRKKDNDHKSKTSASSESDKKSANQDTDQDNVCYRGNETCTQANEAQELIGKDNDAIGFNDQSENLQSFSTSALSSSPSSSPVTNIFSTTNNNITIFVDNSICDQTGSATANSPQEIAITAVSANNSGAGSGLITLTGFALTSTASASFAKTCSVTLSDNASINQGGIPSTPIITLNPTGGPCSAPLVNAVITTTNPVRTLDICIAL